MWSEVWSVSFIGLVVDCHSLFPTNIYNISQEVPGVLELATLKHAMYNILRHSQKYTINFTVRGGGIDIFLMNYCNIMGNEVTLRNDDTYITSLNLKLC